MICLRSLEETKATGTNHFLFLNYITQAVKDKYNNCYKKKGPQIFSCKINLVLRRCCECLLPQYSDNGICFSTSTARRSPCAIPNITSQSQVFCIHRQLAEEKYQENVKRMQEFRSRNFQKLNVNVLHVSRVCWGPYLWTFSVYLFSVCHTLSLALETLFCSKINYLDVLQSLDPLAEPCGPVMSSTAFSYLDIVQQTL